MRIDERVFGGIGRVDVHSSTREGVLKHGQDGEVVAGHRWGEELGSVVGKLWVHTTSSVHVLGDGFLGVEQVTLDDLVLFGPANSSTLR